MEQPLISVIMPVYKVEPYLRKAVDSVLCQSYENLEIILVDDCSPDSCPQICDDYQKSDRRVKVIHHEVNGGLSCARNSGIEAAKGEYIAFIDSDDIINHKMMEILYSELVKNSCDIAVCGFKYVFENDIVDPSENASVKNETVLSGIDAVKRIFSPKYHGEAVVSCNKLYKADLFSEIRFPPHKLHEDMFTTYKLYFKSEKVVFFDCKLYYYLQRSASIMHDQKKKISLCDAIEAVDEFGLYCEEHIDDNALLEEYTEMKNIRKASYALDAYYLARKCGSKDEMIKYERIYLSTAHLIRRKNLKLRIFDINPLLYMLVFRIFVMVNSKQLSQFR